MENFKEQKLCECGCGQVAPIATRNWHKKGIKKGQSLRFVCGHHRRGKIQSREEKIKRAKAWGVDTCEISPYLPGNRLIRYYPNQKRWYCSAWSGPSKCPHARMVYEHHYGIIPEGFVVHHKSGTADKIEDDRPENLMLVSKVWNFRYFPWLAQGFGVPESQVTDCYIKAVEKYPQHEVFKEVCRMLVENIDGVS